MADIIIYTTTAKLLHKQGKLKNDQDYSPSGEYIWTFSNRPKRIKFGSRVYFAIKGFIIGYFVIDMIEGIEICFNCDSWKDIRPVKTNSFQGFKYADKIKELMRA